MILHIAILAICIGFETCRSVLVERDENGDSFEAFTCSSCHLYDAECMLMQGYCCERCHCYGKGTFYDHSCALNPAVSEGGQFSVEGHQWQYSSMPSFSFGQILQHLGFIVGYQGWDRKEYSSCKLSGSSFYWDTETWQQLISNGRQASDFSIESRGVGHILLWHGERVDATLYSGLLVKLGVECYKSSFWSWLSLGKKKSFLMFKVTGARHYYDPPTFTTTKPGTDADTTVKPTGRWRTTAKPSTVTFTFAAGTSKHTAPTSSSPQASTHASTDASRSSTATTGMSKHITTTSSSPEATTHTSTDASTSSLRSSTATTGMSKRTTTTSSSPEATTHKSTDASTSSLRSSTTLITSISSGAGSSAITSFATGYSTSAMSTTDESVSSRTLYTTGRKGSSVNIVSTVVLRTEPVVEKNGDGNGNIMRRNIVITSVVCISALFILFACCICCKWRQRYHGSPLLLSKKSICAPYGLLDESYEHVHLPSYEDVKELKKVGCRGNNDQLTISSFAREGRITMFDWRRRSSAYDDSSTPSSMSTLYPDDCRSLSPEVTRGANPQPGGGFAFQKLSKNESGSCYQAVWPVEQATDPAMSCLPLSRPSSSSSARPFPAGPPSLGEDVMCDANAFAGARLTLLEEWDARGARVQVGSGPYNQLRCASRDRESLATEGSDSTYDQFNC